jgi:hypothetical protein
LDEFRISISAKLGLENSVAGDQPFMDAKINAGVADVLVRSRVKVAVGTMAVTANVADFTLPTNILAIEDCYLTSGGSQYSLARVSPIEILDMRRNSVAGSPSTRYAVNGSQLLMLYPTPTDPADVITVYYVPRPAVLTLGTDTPSDIPSEFHDAVEYFALAQAADLSDDAGSQDGARYTASYENRLRMLKRAALQKGGRRLSPAVVGHRRRRPYGRPDQQAV